MTALLWLSAAPWALAGDMCPAPPKHHPKLVTEQIITDGDHRIHIDSDDAVLGADGHAVLNGHVKVNQDGRSVSADTVTYDSGSGKISVKGSVDFEDPRLAIRSDSGDYDTVGRADFEKAYFDIFERNGRGYAREIKVEPDGNIGLTQVRYTTCPVGNEDWMLQASKIDLDTNEEQGVGRGVVMRFKDVPIFYTPYISFPLGDERKSGMLFPSIGHSGNNGYLLAVPYYFNLAPNYDMTLTPTLLSRRGLQLGGEFRYLTEGSKGKVEASFLPSDHITNSDRTYAHITDVTDFEQGLRFDADVASVSDSTYFEDFAVGSEQTSVTYLERRMDVLHYDDVWRIRGELQNFQTIDIGVPTYDRPYSRVPSVQAQGLYPLGDSHFELAFDGELTNFVRSLNTDLTNEIPAGAQTNGVRLNLAPEIRWSYRGPGYYIEPAAGYNFTQYDLRDTLAGTSSTPTRALPYARVDMGMVFERDAGSQGQRSQTLEPRVVYSYVPYRNQDSLPIFDSGLPDLNLTELFRTNRFVGDDRIGDANQLALGLTTRLFDQHSGAQYLSATIGQIRYFDIPRVGLPLDAITNTTTAQILNYLPSVNPLASPYQNYLNLTGRRYTDAVGGVTSPLVASQAAYPASDVVTEIALTAYKHTSFNLEYQWNPYTQHTDKTEVSVQYRPDAKRVVNLGYRFQQGIVKQADASFAWPILDHWNAVGRWVYSIQDRQTIEQVAGFQYKSCCWRIELVQRRYVARRSDLTTNSASLDTSIALQLELIGLSSVGKPADAFLEQEIRGYSSRDPDVVP